MASGDNASMVSSISAPGWHFSESGIVPLLPGQGARSGTLGRRWVLLVDMAGTKSRREEVQVHRCYKSAQLEASCALH